jgi:hypothetical protein
MNSGRFVATLLFLIIFAAGFRALAQSRGPETAPAHSEKAVKTSIEMKVRGILAVGEGDDRRSSAIIAMKDGSEGKAYSPGQFIDDNPDLRLMRIQDERIEFLNHGRLEFASVKRFPDASASSSSGNSSPSAYAAPDIGGSDNKNTPRTPFRQPRPPRRSASERDGGIAPMDVQP